MGVCPCRLRLPRRFAPRNDSREEGELPRNDSRERGELPRNDSRGRKGGWHAWSLFFLMFWVAVAILFLLEVICLKLRLLTVLC